MPGYFTLHHDLFEVAPESTHGFLASLYRTADRLRWRPFPVDGERTISDRWGCSRRDLRTLFALIEQMGLGAVEVQTSGNRRDLRTMTLRCPVPAKPEPRRGPREEPREEPREDGVEQDNAPHPDHDADHDADHRVNHPTISEPEPELEPDIPTPVGVGTDGSSHAEPPSLFDEPANHRPSARTLAALAREHRDSPEALAALAPSQVRALPGIGPAALREIEAWLGGHGLALAPEPARPKSPTAALERTAGEAWDAEYRERYGQAYPWALPGPDLHHRRTLVGAFALEADLDAGLLRLRAAARVYFDAADRHQAWPPERGACLLGFVHGLETWTRPEGRPVARGEYRPAEPPPRQKLRARTPEDDARTARLHAFAAKREAGEA